MENRDRIRSASKKFRFMLLFVLIAIPVLNAGIWIFFNYLPEAFVREMIPVSVGKLSPGTCLAGFLVSMIPSGVAMIGIYVLIRLFRLYENAQIFTPENVRCFRNLGRILMIWAAAGILYDPMISLALTLANPPGQRMITVSLGSPDITALLVGGIISLMAWVMEEGRILQDEQNFTI